MVLLFLNPKCNNLWVKLMFDSSSNRRVCLYYSHGTGEARTILRNFPVLFEIFFGGLPSRSLSRCIVSCWVLSTCGQEGGLVPFPVQFWFDLLAVGTISAQFQFRSKGFYVGQGFDRQKQPNDWDAPEMHRARGGWAASALQHRPGHQLSSQF